MNQPRRILIVKLSSIGDVLLTTPIARALRDAFPQAHITWAVDRRCAPVVTGNPYLDDVLVMQCNGELSRLGCYWRTTRAAGRFDWTLDLHGIARSAIVTWASGAPVRIGLAGTREGSGLAYTRKVAMPQEPIHRVDYYLAFIEALGVPVTHRDMLFPILPENEAEARALIESELPGSGPLVLVSLSAGRAQKCWPADRYGVVADRLMEQHGCRVAVVGGNADRPLVEQMKARMGRPPVDLTGRIGLKTLAALLRHTDLFLSADTGPMHIAAAVKTPVLALFGPTDPALYGPHRVEHTVLRRTCRCAPRWRRPVCEDRECMRAITVDEVEEAAAALLVRVAAR